MGVAESPDLSGVAFHLSKAVYRYHQYQGLTNDCGPTSLAIAANALLGREAFQAPAVAEDEVSRLYLARREQLSM